MQKQSVLTKATYKTILTNFKIKLLNLYLAFTKIKLKFVTKNCEDLV